MSLRTARRPPPFDPAWFATVFLVPDPPPRWPERFAIVTAHNPEGIVIDAACNAELERALDEVLARRGLASFEVTGAAPDLSHRERGRGFAVAGIADGAAIAARLRQQGFFWVEDGEVYIAVDGSGEVWPLGRWSDRLRTCP